MAAAAHLELERKPGSLALGFLGALFFFGCGAVIFSKVPADGLTRDLVGTLTIALGAAGAGVTANRAWAARLEVDERGFRWYRHGRVRTTIPWEGVQWVAYGRWPVNPRGPSPTALSFTVQGARLWQTLWVNDFSYRLPSGTLDRFAQSALNLARSRSVPVLPKPAYYAEGRRALRGASESLPRQRP